MGKGLGRHFRACSQETEAKPPSLEDTLKSIGFTSEQPAFFQILGGEFRIFVIDNDHFIDPASWIIMSRMLRKIPDSW